MSWEFIVIGEAVKFISGVIATPLTKRGLLGVKATNAFFPCI
jgi:hypothetical protein